MIEKTQVSGLVSIIMPSYNASEFILGTLETVMAQTYIQWELIVADDGSTDTTADIVAQCAAKDERVHLFPVSGRNGSAARARNQAMMRAKGEYFALLDADDLWLPEKLWKQVDYLDTNSQVDGVCTWFENFGDKAEIMHHNQLINYGMSSQVKNSLVCSRDEAIHGCLFLTSTVMFRRGCFDDIGGMDEDERLRSGQDYEYFTRLVMNYTFHRMHEVLTLYRIVPANASLSKKHLVKDYTVGWNIYNVLMEKGVYTEEEAKKRRGILFYDQAKNNLFHLNAPFRKQIFCSLKTGYAPKEAVIIFLLCFLPSYMLKPLLIYLLEIKNKMIQRSHKQ